MEMPPIPYALAGDGATLAYRDTGAGHPFLHMPYLMNHLQMQWQSDEFSAFY